MLALLSVGLNPQRMGVPAGAMMPPATAGGRLDPLALIANKGAQTSTRRPYCPPAANGGLHTATLALG